MSDPSSTLSIIIPTRDTRELTLACIASITRSASESPTTQLEILVVDDGSTDGTAEALRDAFPEVVVLPTTGGVGFTRAVNLGLSQAHGDWLLLLNSDTEWTPGGLGHLQAAFAHDSGLGIVGGRLVYPDGRDQWSGGARPDAVWLFVLASGLANPLRRLPGYSRWRRSRGGGEVDWVSGAALALRREVWETVGRLDEDFRFYAQDLDFCLRARALGWRVVVLPGFRVVHHHGSTIQRRPGASHLPYQPSLLWHDLVLWAAKEGGRRRARSVARILRWGTRLRLLGRSLAAPFAADRARHRAESDAFRAALGALLHPPPVAG
ncbi:MAG: glycosyltransferase family 2 protein [Thermoanaerobaculia bacterium]|nr:glycosyltransferase family 2 protein [Thermoanaerobaculia bacterium]